MAKYRKKPVIIEAEEYKPGMEDGFEENRPYIKTLEGKLFISPGDYIVTGVNGERYPVKPDIFHKTYEPIENVDNGNDSDFRVYREAVLGWAIVGYKIAHGGHEGEHVDAVPLVSNWRGELDDIADLCVDPDSRVIAVIPAFPGTYQVLGTTPDGPCVALGYEFPGAFCPDWHKSLIKISEV